MIEVLQLTTTDWLVFASVYGAIMTLAVVVLWSLLDRARNETRGLRDSTQHLFGLKNKQGTLDGLVVGIRALVPVHVALDVRTLKSSDLRPGNLRVVITEPLVRSGPESFDRLHRIGGGR
jgi:hypothetical protein